MKDNSLPPGIILVPARAGMGTGLVVPALFRWDSALSEPKDKTLASDSAEYDFERPLYRCEACIAEGETSMHKYVDECPFFDDRAIV